MKNFGAASAAVAAPNISMTPAQAQGKRRVIDIHHHYFPDVFKEASGRRDSLPSVVKAWSAQGMIEEMDKNNIDQSILSIATAPIGWFRMKEEESRPLIRTINESGARLVQDHKGRLGLFAYISGNDVDGSLKEIEYAFDVLKADGIELMTSFGDKWPGDPAFDAIFAELNRRNAIVYFHPIAPFCCGGLVPGVSDSWIEYAHDSTRAILSLLFNGTFARYRNIKWLFSQAGGTLPFVAHRVEWLSRQTLKSKPEIAPNGILAEFQRLYYETANAASAPAIAGLLKLVAPSQVMYGSDYPYVTSEYNLANLRGQGLSDADIKAIEYQNVEKMIPRLKV